MDRGVAAKFLQRGARLVLASWLLNLLGFRDEPFWEGGGLQATRPGHILWLPPARAIFSGSPPMRLLHHRVARYALLAVTIGLYVLFSVSFPALVGWLPAHPVIGRTLFFEFPPWPWIS